MLSICLVVTILIFHIYIYIYIYTCVWIYGACIAAQNALVCCLWVGLKLWFFGWGGGQSVAFSTCESEIWTFVCDHLSSNPMPKQMLKYKNIWFECIPRCYTCFSCRPQPQRGKLSDIVLWFHNSWFLMEPWIGALPCGKSSIVSAIPRFCKAFLCHQESSDIRYLC